MKKTILLFALGLGTICLSSCSRGYGCPYTMDTTIQNQSTDLAERKEQKNTKSLSQTKLRDNEEESITTGVEIPTTAVYAD
ncbi:MAG: hypothetical protein ACI8P3_001871 [Saprospiraceae bacterium]|jgi:hypothetical protein